MSENIKSILKQTEVFKSLSDGEIEKIAQLASIYETEKDSRLFKEGESADSLWVIAQGNIDLRFELPARQASKQQTITTLSTKKILGWSSLIPPRKYRLSAYCASPECSLVKINGKQLIEYLKDNPGAGYQIMSAMIKVVGNRFADLQASADATPMAKA